MNLLLSGSIGCTSCKSTHFFPTWPCMRHAMPQALHGMPYQPPSPAAVNAQHHTCLPYCQGCLNSSKACHACIHACPGVCQLPASWTATVPSAYATPTCWVIHAAGVSWAAGVGAAAGCQRCSRSIFAGILIRAGVGVGGGGVIGVTCW